MDDILHYEVDGHVQRAFVDEAASNIAAQMSVYGTRPPLIHLKRLVFAWPKIECSVNHVLNLSVCPKQHARI